MYSKLGVAECAAVPGNFSVVLRFAGVLEILAGISVGDFAFAIAFLAIDCSGNLRYSRVGKSGGIDPWSKASNLSRVLVAVNKGPTIIRGLEASFAFVKTGRQL